MRPIILLFFIIICVSAHAQSEQSSDYKSIICIACDKETSILLDKAVMYGNGKIYLPDYAGRLSGKFKNGDVLIFKHIGYHSATLTISDSLNTQSIVAIYMSRDTIELSEVTITPKLEYNTEELTNYSIARQNFKMYKNLAFSTPAYTWDAKDNQQFIMSRNIMAMEYRHMIAPDQMFGVGTYAIGLIINTIKQISNPHKKRTRHDYVNEIRSITAEEMQQIISESNRKRWEIAPIVSDSLSIQQNYQ